MVEIVHFLFAYKDQGDNIYQMNVLWIYDSARLGVSKALIWFGKASLFIKFQADPNAFIKALEWKG